MALKVPFINYPLQYNGYKDEILKTIDNMLQRGDVYMRSDMQKFEKNLAKYVGSKFAIGVDCCTDALFLSMIGAGIGAGDEVITVSHTFIASINTIVACGAKPILVDIGDDFNINIDLIEESITPKTKAIMPIHLNGHLCQMDKLMEIAKKHNLIIIEDAAQALGAKFKGKNGGTFGLTGCISFYPAKMLGTYGDAGAIITDDEELADKLYMIRDHGMKPSYRLKEGENPYEIHMWGYNSVLDNIHGAILNVKMKYFPQYIERRREIALLYDKAFKDLEIIKTPPRLDSYFDVYQNYVIRVPKRDEFKQFLKENKIETLVKDAIPNHFWPNLNLKHFSLPKTEQFSKEVITLPLYPELKNDQIEYVIEKTKEFFK